MAGSVTRTSDMILKMFQCPNAERHRKFRATFMGWISASTFITRETFFPLLSREKIERKRLASTERSYMTLESTSYPEQNWVELPIPEKTARLVYRLLESSERFWASERSDPPSA